jgi:phenylacetate-CoA ligase
VNTYSLIKKFVESHWVIERSVLQILERLPVRVRYGISYGRTFRYWLGFLKLSEKWDKERHEVFQVEQMRDLLIHAAKNVSYYKNIFNEFGFKPEKIQRLEDIKVLPFIDRKIIKKRLNEFIAENIPKNRLIPAYTSGTSGIPLTVYGTKETEEKHWATVVDLWSRIGYSPGSRTVFFDSNRREGKRKNLPWTKYGNKLTISSNYFTKEWLDKFVDMINRFKPEYLIGFPHTVATFSYYVKNHSRSIYDGLKGVILYGENIYKWQRDIIMHVLGARVFSDYGMVEKVIHAGDCEHAYTYHIYPQYGFTEYLDLGDSLHELVGTGFINYSMPFIRYKTGDVCSVSDGLCKECGRKYDTVPELQGRLGDVLINADGQIVSVYPAVDYRLFVDIDRFQLYQEVPGHVELRIWPKDTTVKFNADNILAVIKRCLGPVGKSITFGLMLMKEEEIQLPKKYRMVDQRLKMEDFISKT